jgi:AraC-like DNA-binding protein
MAKIIFLLAPVFASLFWIIALYSDKNNQTNPRKMLMIFMIIVFICFTSHYLYFSPLRHLYHYVDVLLTYVGHIGFPIYYIYFRLLTVDEKFTFKAHGIYLVPSLILTTIYAIGVLLTPTIEYRTWLFDDNAFSDSLYIQFLRNMRIFLRVWFLLLISATYIGNYLLLKKYGYRAEQYYSDINDGKYNNASLLNYSILILTASSFVALVLGRQYILPKDTMIYVLWTIYAITVYFIGYMGIRQKAVNPTFDLEENELNKSTETSILIDQNVVHQKILLLFNEKKIYLNSRLNIMDIVKEVGTNRTAISNLINHHYNQNFCSFVNGYRIEELARVHAENPKYTNELLAETCGFGSLNSLKRAVEAKTGLSLSEWRKQHKQLTS